MSQTNTIWVVEQGQYSDYTVVGVFTTQANAQMVADLLNNTDTYPAATIAEWPLNPAVEELRQGYSLFYIQMAEDGTTERCEQSIVASYTVTNGLSVWRRTQAPAYVATNRAVQDCVHGAVWAKDTTHAIKITNEFRLRAIAKGEIG